MGINGLQQFLETSCLHEGCRPVRVRGLLQAYRDKHNLGPTDEVALALHGETCARFLYNTHSESDAEYSENLKWWLGGQYLLFASRVKCFVEALKSIDPHMRLVIFFNGSVHTLFRTREDWTEHRLTSIKKRHAIFDTLYDGNDVVPLDAFSMGIPCMLSETARYIFKYECKNDCEVRQSVSRKSEQDLCEFTQSDEHNCFAILGQESQLVIYDSPAYYLSARQLDWWNGKEMTTFYYDRQGLCDVLNIPSYHLPLLGTLCGNNTIRVGLLQDFHFWTCRPRNFVKNDNYQGKRPFPLKYVFYGVSKYIRRLNIGADVLPYLRSIAVDVFGDENQAELLELSINSFRTTGDEHAKNYTDTLDPTWNAILSQAQQLHITIETTRMYSIMDSHLFEMSKAFEDITKTDLPLVGPLLIHLRQRIYGILLKEKPGGPGTVEEWVTGSIESATQEALVTPILPDKDLHPGLLVLWDSARDDVRHLRWELFAKSVSPRLNADDLQRLPVHLVIPTAILFYMRQEIPRTAATDDEPEYLEDFEVAALAVQAVMISATDPSLLTVEPPYDVRAIRLATIFMRSVSQMLLLLASCGFPIPMKEALPWHYFDGKLFHVTYKALKEGGKTTQQLCGDQVENSFFYQFELIRNIVLQY